MFIINEILKISMFIDLLIFSFDNILNEGLMFPLWVYRKLLCGMFKYCFRNFCE